MISLASTTVPARGLTIGVFVAVLGLALGTKPPELRRYLRESSLLFHILPIGLPAPRRGHASNEPAAAWYSPISRLASASTTSAARFSRLRWCCSVSADAAARMVAAQLSHPCGCVLTLSATATACPAGPE
jgi:hypothetical protein